VSGAGAHVPGNDRGRAVRAGPGRTWRTGVAAGVPQPARGHRRGIRESADFASAYPPTPLLQGALDVSIAGLSLNLICQQIPDEQLCALVEAGARFRCLFLDPHGASVASREREEGHPVGALSTLTELNIRMFTERVRPRLSPTGIQRLQVAVYDETIRFNILLVDDRRGVVQPYLPAARGIDSPTLVLEAREYGAGLLPTFRQVFESMWERGNRL